MNLEAIVNELGLKVQTGKDLLNREITRGYASDLMSDVIANAQAGDIWITLQVHINVVAIASMREIGAIILTHNRQPLPETEKKAREEGVPILVSDLPAFELVGRLYSLGISGT